MEYLMTWNLCDMRFKIQNHYTIIQSTKLQIKEESLEVQKRQKTTSNDT